MKTAGVEKTSETVSEFEDDIFYELEISEAKRRKQKLYILIITVLIIILLLLVFRLGNIGFKRVIFSEIDSFSLTEKNTYLEEFARINVFGAFDLPKEQLIDGYRVIAPKSSGTYRFSVSNKTNANTVYDIIFSEVSPDFVNMKYRLKIDNIYIKGNDSEYVDISELSVKNVVVPKKSVNVYTLEWLWESDDEKDAMVASVKERQYYTIKLNISSRNYEN